LLTADKQQSDHNLSFEGCYIGVASPVKNLLNLLKTHHHPATGKSVAEVASATACRRQVNFITTCPPLPWLTQATCWELLIFRHSRFAAAVVTAAHVIMTVTQVVQRL
jgi:hypothetical protein